MPREAPERPDDHPFDIPLLQEPSDHDLLVELQGDLLSTEDETTLPRLSNAEIIDQVNEHAAPDPDIPASDVSIEEEESDNASSQIDEPATSTAEPADPFYCTETCSCLYELHGVLGEEGFNEFVTSLQRYQSKGELNFFLSGLLLGIQPPPPIPEAAEHPKRIKYNKTCLFGQEICDAGLSRLIHWGTHQGRLKTLFNIRHRLSRMEALPDAPLAAENASLANHERSTHCETFLNRFADAEGMASPSSLTRTVNGVTRSIIWLHPTFTKKYVYKNRYLLL